jgi:hypothetical protein
MCRSRLNRLAWIFALILLTSSRVLRADTVTYFSTGTATAEARFLLHSDGAPVFATISDFTNISNNGSQLILAEPPVILPAGSKINSVTLNYSLIPNEYFSQDVITATGPCFVSELQVPCNTLPTPTFHDVNLAVSPTMPVSTSGAAVEFGSVDSLAGSLMLPVDPPFTDWEGYLNNSDLFRVAFDTTLLPPPNPGLLINDPGAFQPVIVTYLAGVEFKEDLSLTIDYTKPEVPPPPVPEPDTIWLMTSGLVSIGALVRKRSQRLVRHDVAN